MTSKVFENILPQRLKIYCPLINGEQWARNLGISARGPFSDENGLLFIVIDGHYRQDFIEMHKRSRGRRRKQIKGLLPSK